MSNLSSNSRNSGFNPNKKMPVKGGTSHNPAYPKTGPKAPPKPSLTGFPFNGFPSVTTPPTQSRLRPSRRNPHPKDVFHDYDAEKPQEAMATTTSSSSACCSSGPEEPCLNYLQHGNLTIAVEGCGHGALTDIYSSIARTASIHKLKVDLLIICGDFQAIRNHNDLPCLSCPAKYRELGDFAPYYSGEKKAPITTVFIGGNHEASNYMFELFHGGWVAPKIYYLGAAGVVNFGGLRIGGISGIYKSGDYGKGCYERVPYVGGMVKSAYHIREYDVFRLFQISEPIDIGLSHDWPEGIVHFGNADALFKVKPHFRLDHENGELGSKPAWGLLRKWRPRFWFSGHMHCKFTALVEHDVLDKQEGLDGRNKPEVKNEEEIDLEMEVDDIDGKDWFEEQAKKKSPSPAKNNEEINLEMDDSSPPPSPSKSTKSEPKPTSSSEAKDPHPATPLPPVNKTTRFLALDKITAQRQFLQLLNIPLDSTTTSTTPPSSATTTKSPQQSPKLCYDPEWLSIVKTFSALIPKPQRPTQRNLEDAVKDLAANRAWVDENIVAKNLLTIPENFEITAPTQAELGPVNIYTEIQSEEQRNPQTAAFCKLLDIDNKIFSSREEKERRVQEWQRAQERERAGEGSYGGGRGGYGGGRGGRGGRGGGRGRGGKNNSRRGGECEGGFGGGYRVGGADDVRGGVMDR
ncbi:hypothetical protein BJ508DRAFT_412691 [Ascobolus immersus RN42]|uniref:Lariat debranching enzyme C-terminal domain-containing protein n=1 Tax=Ascobolus immersus RN42 TaxID=1160509 RepID=A0A3N4IGU4_ASCIM|nr:hypothetical protein BJ508DRAFT_412691 [Ascobolus immersus RN42]